MNDTALSLHPLDWVVLAGYFAVIVTVGLCFAKALAYRADKGLRLEFGGAW